MNCVLLGYGTVGKGVEKLVKTIDGLEMKHVFVLPEEADEPYFTNRGHDVVTDPETDIVFECLSGTEPANTLITEALKAGKHVITSNKATVCPNLERYVKLADENGGSIQIEASVAGGIHFLDALLKLSLLEDLDGYEGIFNGTCNYILDEMQKKETPYEEALATAQKLGYAEFNPDADVEGWDVFYKTNISNALAYKTPVQGLMDPLGISKITLEDIDLARNNNKIIRHLSVSKQKDGKFYSVIAPAFLNPDDYLANVESNYNAQLIYGPSFEKLGYFGQGAGRFPTAQAMAANAIDLLNNTRRPIELNRTLELDPSVVEEDWLIRSDKDLSGFDVDKEYFEKDHYWLARQKDRSFVQEILEADPDAMIALWRE